MVKDTILSQGNVKFFNFNISNGVALLKEIPLSWYNIDLIESNKFFVDGVRYGRSLIMIVLVDTADNLIKPRAVEN